MNKYQIKDPRNGNPITFEAKTDEEANEMQRLILSEIDQGRKALTYAMTRDGGRVLSANGKLIYTSSGMATSNPQKIAKILESERTNGDTARQMAESEISEEIVSQQELPARLSKFTQGIPFAGEYIDEAVSALGNPQSAEKLRTLQGAMDTARPIESGALQVGGALATGPLAGVKRFTGTTLERAGKAGLSGGLLAGAEGAVSGFGAGENMEQRLDLAKDRGLIGAGVGTGVGVFSPYIGDAAKASVNKLSEISSNIKNKVTSVFKRTNVEDLASNLGISKEAAAVIKNAIDAGGTIEDAQKAIQQAGSQGMVADANEASKVLLDAVMATGGEANVIGNRAVSGRLDQAAQGASEALDTVLGLPPVGRRSVAEDIANQTKDARSQAYNKAYSQTVPYTSEPGQDLIEVLNRIPSDVKERAISVANLKMASDPNTTANAKEIVMRDLGDGTFDFEELPSVIQLDYIKRALDDMARRGFNDPNSSSYQAFARQLRDATVRAVPSFGEALKQGSDKIGMDEAFALGYDMLTKKLTREDMARSMGGATPVEINLVKRGARTFIDETLANIRSGITGSTEEIAEARKLLSTFSDRASLDKMSQVLDNAELVELMGKLRELRSAFEMRAATAGGSQTAIRQNVQQGIDEMTQQGPLRMLQSGNPIDASRRIISALTGMTDEFSEQQRQAVFADIARGLTDKKGPQARAALNYVQQAIESGRIDERRAQFVADTINKFMLSGSTAAENIRGN